MKKLIYKILLFILIIFLVEKPFGYLVSQGILERQYDQRLEKLFAGEIRSEVIILGSSRSLNGIDAGQLGEKLGQTIYNFGFSGSNLNFHESLFNIISNVYIPNKVLLVIDDKNAFKLNEKAIYRKDKLYPFIQYDAVLKELANNSNKNYLASKVSWLYRENQNIFESFNFYLKGQLEPDETTNVDEFGFVSLSSKKSHLINSVNRNLSFEYDIFEEQPTYLASLKKIIKSCNQLGVNLYLVRLPSINAKLVGYNKRLTDLVGGNIPILDFSNELQDERYHFDNGHLNSKGAKAMANLISQSITK
ncbi:hypothetical protein OAB47_00570 [Vicingaceae bacterium]|nr:hypothetical protein [Vicingaceae bacterium]